MSSIVKRDEAVSPVIGTILLVAITVVLVAIVAAVVMGMVGNVGESKNVGVIVTPYSDTNVNGVVVTISSGADANKVNNMTAYLDGTALVNGDSNKEYVADPEVGIPYTFNTSGTTAVTGTVTVSASFVDNTTQVIYTGNVAIPAKTGTE